MTKKADPYAELGEVLQSWRKEKFSSALSFFKQQTFKVSYSVYANFERGKVLPTPEFLTDFAAIFEKSPAELMYTWAKVQMPNQELRALFEVKPRAVMQTAIEDSVPPPDLENTYVMGSVELKIMLKHPWVWDIISALTVRFPNEIPFHEIKLPRGIFRKTLIEEILKVPIAAEKIIVSETGIRLATPHAHIPKSKEWDEVRKNNMIQAVDDIFVLPKYESCRRLIQRSLTPEQAEYWQGEILRFIDHFKGDTYYQTPQPSYMLSIMFGERNLADRSKAKPS